MSFYTWRGGIRYFFVDQKGVDQVLFRRSKRESKDFLKLKREDHLYFLKGTKYFVKHFRFQRKGLSDATRGRKLQWNLFKSM